MTEDEVAKRRHDKKRIPAKYHKPRRQHKFTEEECSDGGANARYNERVKGIKLNHGVTFGRRS